MLMHHADASGHRVSRARELGGLSVYQNLTLVSFVEAVKNVHQSGFTCAIFSKQAVNLS